MHLALTYTYVSCSLWFSTVGQKDIYGWTPPNWNPFGVRTHFHLWQLPLLWNTNWLFIMVSWFGSGYSPSSQVSIGLPHFHSLTLFQYKHCPVSIDLNKWGNILVLGFWDYHWCSLDNYLFLHLKVHIPLSSEVYINLTNSPSIALWWVDL